MKLRIRGNSIRLRLTQSEVAQLRETGRVEERVDFGASVFAYALEAGEAQSPGAEFAGERLRVYVPRAAARAWADSDEVAIEAFQPTNGGRDLRVLIEKDFACRQERPHESDADAFPNPLEKAC